jgi:putative two-component system response regulator
MDVRITPTGEVAKDAIIVQSMLEHVHESLRQVLSHKLCQSDTLSGELDLVVDLVEFRCDNICGHSARTREYMQLLVQALVQDDIYRDVVSGWNLDVVVDASRLHDIGKAAISDWILGKPGKLTQFEFDTMKTHAAIGVTIIRRMENTIGESGFFDHAKMIAMNHHEKWDGSGYPHGLRGEKIPLEGRLMAIVDVYDALISARSYKKPFPTDYAEHFIVQRSGRHFDPVLVDIFEKAAPGFAAVAGHYQ